MAAPAGAGRHPWFITDIAGPWWGWRWGMAFGAAALSLAFIVMAVACIQGRPMEPLPHFGLSRIAAALSTWPILRDTLPYVVAAEWLFIAVVLFLAAPALLTRFSPPTPIAGEMLIFRSRQDWRFRWSWLVGGMALLLAAEPLMETVRPVLLGALGGVEQSWHFLRQTIFGGAPPVARAPGLVAILHPVLVGLVELAGLQWLCRFFWTFAMPFTRAYMVVVLDAAGEGIANRIVVGDGQFRRQGSLTIWHERLVEVGLRSNWIQRTFLGLASLRVTYIDSHGSERSFILDGPGSLKDTEALHAFLQGWMFRRAPSRDAFTQASGLRAMSRMAPVPPSPGLR